MGRNIQSMVVKLGTSTLTGGTPNLCRRTLMEAVRQLVTLHERGVKVLVVTSGAVAAGREILRTRIQEKMLPSKQMLAATGQVRLMQVWTDMFGIYNVPVAQLLLTRSDFANRKRYLNVRDTLTALWQHGVIPIVNENDAVVMTENRVGDNDNLSALIANMVAAQLLVLLTDQRGLYDKNPRIHADAAFIPLVETIDDSIYSYSGASLTDLGTGGMVTKIQAAVLATQSGTPTIIADFKEKDLLIELQCGIAHGTLFTAKNASPESRKRWLLSEKPQGSLHVDSGAASKLQDAGASLLAVGITAVGGLFDRGAVVRIVDDKNRAIALGLVNYKSQDIAKILGLRSEGIEEALGYSYGQAVVHRDNMAILVEASHDRNF